MKKVFYTNDMQRRAYLTEGKPKAWTRKLIRWLKAAIERGDIAITLSDIADLLESRILSNRDEYILCKVEKPTKKLLRGIAEGKIKTGKALLVFGDHDETTRYLFEKDRHDEEGEYRVLECPFKKERRHPNSDRVYCGTWCKRMIHYKQEGLVRLSCYDNIRDMISTPHLQNYACDPVLFKLVDDDRYAMGFGNDIFRSIDKDLAESTGIHSPDFCG